MCSLPISIPHMCTHLFLSLWCTSSVFCLASTGLRWEFSVECGDRGFTCHSFKQYVCVLTVMCPRGTASVWSAKAVLVESNSYFRGSDKGQWQQEQAGIELYLQNFPKFPCEGRYALATYASHCGISAVTGEARSRSCCCTARHR